MISTNVNQIFLVECVWGTWFVFGSHIMYVSVISLQEDDFEANIWGKVCGYWEQIENIIKNIGHLGGGGKHNIVKESYQIIHLGTTQFQKIPPSPPTSTLTLIGLGF